MTKYCEYKPLSSSIFFCLSFPRKTPDENNANTLYRVKVDELWSTSLACKELATKSILTLSFKIKNFFFPRNHNS